MDIETAKEKLRIEGQFDSETVKAAYLDRVKAVRGDGDFETLLQDLNVARDTLLMNQNGSRELVPVLARELAVISAKQNELIQVNDARDEIREAFGAIERRSISRIKGTRDLTGVLGAASAALAFGKDNLAEFFPALADSTQYSQVLLLCSAFLALFAFLANRRSSEMSSRMDEIKRNLTRDRQISRLLVDVFRDDESLEEIDFVVRLEFEINDLTGGRVRSGSMNRIFGFYETIGLLVPTRIHLGRDFVDEYIDYLLKSGHVKATGVSGQDMIFHKVK